MLYKKGDGLQFDNEINFVPEIPEHFRYLYVRKTYS